jgi:hypothetical protein
MANDVHTCTEPSLTGLVTGIINDAQELLRQQLALFKQEVKEDIRKTKEAALSMSVGLGILEMGGILLGLMLVHLVNDLLALPLWSCYAMVGLVLVACGGALWYAGKKRFESLNPLPEQSVNALKENVRWILNPKK